jgi:hypothetical protein
MKRSVETRRDAVQHEVALTDEGQRQTLPRPQSTSPQYLSLFSLSNAWPKVKHDEHHVGGEERFRQRFSHLWPLFYSDLCQSSEIQNIGSLPIRQNTTGRTASSQGGGRDDTSVGQLKGNHLVGT